MKASELLKLKLKEVLEEYVAVVSLECGYTYGICKATDAETINEKYKLEDEPCFVFETILPADIFFEIDDEHEILTESKMDKICNNLGLEFKNEKIIHK